ncbi:MAG TPA: hypothetical protein VLM89_17550 [Phycisphaerae bacterium]|nr:hypothetical protein [Phycisphaerae bacterium]
MLPRNVLIVALVGLNLLLLAGVIFVACPPPAAIAQEAPAAGSGEWGLLACQVEIGNDVIYVLDARNQLLHAFRTPFPHQIGDPVQIIYISTRDLSREFRKEGQR